MQKVEGSNINGGNEIQRIENVLSELEFMG